MAVAVVQQGAPLRRLRTSVRRRPSTNVMRRSLLERPARPKRRRVFSRLCQLSFFVLRWEVQNIFDRWVAKTREEARLRGAQRLSRDIKKLGGTLIKLGQQASLRKDLLPEEYCDQLTDLLDEAPPFSVSEAYRAIEAQTGKPWQETFAVFISEPIGSASIACVYRALLHNGDEVAVKVRRPRIREAFETDLAVIDVLAQFLEFLMVFPAGLTDSFRSELRTMLIEELDFHSEVRYQELFRRYLMRRKKLNVTAPKIYYELSGRDVIVSELVNGISVKEMIAKLDAPGAEEYLAYLQSLGIEPHRVAKRLIRAQYYQFHECPFFHGDPHPANIVVQSGGRIVMIDFGACGVFSERDRNLMLQMHYYYGRGDVAGMVQCVINLMEPVPPIDVDEFSKYLQEEWWKGYYGIISKHVDWSERTSYRLWTAMLRGFRAFGIPMPLKMIRMVRATLLYDTVAAQLYSKINVFQEFEKYYTGVARRVRIHFQESAIRQILLGPDDSAYLKIRQIGDVANALLFWLQKFLAEGDFNFAAQLNKVSTVVNNVVQMLWRGFIITLWALAIGLPLVLARLLIRPDSPPWLRWLLLESPTRQWLWNPWSAFHSDNYMLKFIVGGWLVLIVLTFLSYGRRTILQFRRKDEYRFAHRVG